MFWGNGSGKYLTSNRFYLLKLVITCATVKSDFFQFALQHVNIRLDRYLNVFYVNKFKAPKFSQINLWSLWQAISDQPMGRVWSVKKSLWEPSSPLPSRFLGDHCIAWLTFYQVSFIQQKLYSLISFNVSANYHKYPPLLIFLACCFMLWSSQCDHMCSFAKKDKKTPALRQRVINVLQHLHWLTGFCLFWRLADVTEEKVFLIFSHSHNIIAFGWISGWTRTLLLVEKRLD